MAQDTLKLFRKAVFWREVASVADLPQDGVPQIVLAGKSNVGKSSLLNRLCDQKNLARTGKKQGKTRNLIFFQVAGRLYFVDVPGYGFAASSQQEKERFNALTDDYLHSGSPLALILHLVDARHPLSEGDLLMLAWLAAADVPYCLVLNKCDKLSASQLAQNQQAIMRQIRADRGMSYPILAVSAQSGMGLPELRSLIAETLQAFSE